MYICALSNFHHHQIQIAQFFFISNDKEGNNYDKDRLRNSQEIRKIKPQNDFTVVNLSRDTFLASTITFNPLQVERNSPQGREMPLSKNMSMHEQIFG